ncbi:hypothetical protein ACZ90_57790 [Streptomyces albus subsp. albus]|nr:hypothetical protein ACZ90_57790 [Streptomyces albus subsp. albus]
MTPAQLSRIVLRTVRHAVEADELRVSVPERVLVETPPRPGCGDYATNVALRLAKGQERAPREVAEILRRRLLHEPGIAGVEVAGPGFLNITLASVSHAALVREVCARGTAYGHGTALAGTEARFAPADEIRAAVWTDAAVRLLRAQGAVAGVVADGPERVRVRPWADGAGRDGRPPAAAGPAVHDAVADRGVGHHVADHAPLARHALADHDPLAGHHPAHHHPLFVRLGSDAARWALLRPAAQDAAVGDSGLLVQREGNPLFRVRYAHARARAVLRNGRQLGIEPNAGAEDAAGEWAGVEGAPRSTGQPVEATYRHPAALRLLGLLGDYPRVLEAAARDRAPDRVARGLEAVADAFFRCHDACPPLPCGEQKPSAAHRSRLALADAAGAVLAGGLSLLGISAPGFL